MIGSYCRFVVAALPAGPIAAVAEFSKKKKAKNGEEGSDGWVVDITEYDFKFLRFKKVRTKWQ